MQFRTLDENHDWSFGRGKQSYSKDLAALMLNLKTRILSWVGDCFFDLGAFIDWNNLLDYGRQQEVEMEIKKVAARTDGVLSVNKVAVTIESNRKADISFSVDTIFGSNIQNTIAMTV
jgi:hypothetical protein